MIYREITPADDASIASIIRANLKAHHLDIPGTAYFDPHLDHLSTYYLADPAKRYYLIAEEEGAVAGGVGLAELSFFEDCAELQKLYLTDAVKGGGRSYELMARIENSARALGYKRMYLETTSCLEAAIHLYEKCGYREIEKPAAVVHSAMDRFYLKEL
jgi:putative acetyltransferase